MNGPAHKTIFHMPVRVPACLTGTHRIFTDSRRFFPLIVAIQCEALVLPVLDDDTRYRQDDSEEHQQRRSLQGEP